jgi:hypothetical protein
MSDPLDDIIANLSTKIAAKKGNARAPEMDEIEALEAKEAADAKATQDRMETPDAMAAARAPAVMPPNARPGDSGLLPQPEPFSVGGAAKAIGQQFANEGKAIPAGLVDAFSSGAIPAVQERAGGSMAPGTYQRTMEAGPVGAAIGQTAGIGLSAGAGLLKPIGQAAGTLASALRGSGAVGQLGERAIGGALAGGGYSAADRAIRGGNPEQVFDAGMTGATIGGGIPVTGAAIGGTGAAINRAATNAVGRAEARGADKLIDQATWGQVAKAAKRLETGSEKDLEGAGKEAILETARAQGLGKDLTSQSVPKFANAVEAKKSAAGKEIGEYIQKASELTPGVRLDAVLSSMDELRQAAGPATDRYRAITQEMDRLQGTYAQSNVIGNMPRVPVNDLWKRAQELGANGYAGVGLAYTDPRPAKELGRDLSRALRSPMYDEVNRVALRNPQTVGTPEKFTAARARFTDLSALSDLAEAARPKTTTGKEGLFARLDAMKQIGRAGIGGVAGTAGHLLGGGPGLTTALMVAPYVPMAARATDTAMAKLINAARSGFPAHMYQAAAEQLGVSPDVATKVWAQFGAPASAVTLQPNADNRSEPAPQPQAAPQ